ncbi:metallophosphoesterase [Streptomyces pathocidini]|uniref:Metallophosphoesterase n=1 Tax=Streptomyces pathocidini TaxID=1650571 RepID=A0ABW7US19_9ACTN
MTQEAGQGPVTGATAGAPPAPYGQPPYRQPAYEPRPQEPAHAPPPRTPQPHAPSYAPQPPALHPRAPESHSLHPHSPQPHTPLPHSPQPYGQSPRVPAQASRLPAPQASLPAEPGLAATAPGAAAEAATLSLTLSGEPETGPGAAPAPEAPALGPLYVVGDVHGYLDELREALRAQSLIDEDDHWAAGNTRLWFLGDFTDRGPDGIGVIDLVMRLSAEAAAAGGYCKALMGNHELLLIGAKRFADTPVGSGAGTASFQAAWLLNGGQRTDMERLEDHHLQWMSRLDAIAEEDGHLLVHSDTTAYLEYGDSIEAVNDTVTETLQRNDPDECWDLFRKFTKRFAFRDQSGPQAVHDLLARYGGQRIVHGHSPIPYLLGQVGSEEDEDGGAPAVQGPHVYADGLAVAMDGGVTMAGKLLVVQLPLAD